MGCSCSSAGDIDFQLAGISNKTIRDFYAIGLSKKEIANLRKVFKSFDVTNDNTIGIDEFAIALHIEINKLTKEIFSTLDKDKDGEVSFREVSASALVIP